MRRFEREYPEYALINDGAEGHALIHYYIDAVRQHEQLERAGFAVELVLDDQGVEMRPGADAKDARWLWYVARQHCFEPATAGSPPT